MLTYQDFLEVGEDARNIAEFIRECIREHQTTEQYKTALAADDYDRGLNTTIMNHQKMIVDVTGRFIPDKFSPNWKSASNFFHVDVTQHVQYLLGNGVTWTQEGTAEKLGKDFDTRLTDAGHKAFCGGVAFGFFNLDHLEVFSVLEFAPLYDEETGALMAGIRWWQIDKGKPLRATLYTPNGYTNFLWRTDPKMQVDETVWTRIDADIYCGTPNIPYIIKTRENAADGVEIVEGENYPSFPIVPLYANKHHESELVSLRNKIDAYDMISSGFVNDLDGALIYWIVKGAGGMDDPDLMAFLNRLKTTGAAAPMDGQEVNPVEVNLPYEAREKLLDRLKVQLYEDAMLMNPDDIRAGNVTATQIRAAYERQNVKADAFEYCVIDFLQNILALAGVEDSPTFTRSTIMNVNEEIQTLVLAAQFLGQEYVTRRILTLLGDGDQVEDVLKQIDAADVARLALE